MTSSEVESILDVYWRPGCSACTSLRLVLNDAGINANWRNIYQDRDAAAWVRGVANGNETVPTVSYGGHVVVAPQPRQVVADLRIAHPDLAIRQYRAWPPLRIVQWLTILGLLVTSQAFSSAGRSAASWGINGLALIVFFAIRRLRMRGQDTTARSTSPPTG